MLELGSIGAELSSNYGFSLAKNYLLAICNSGFTNEWVKHPRQKDITSPTKGRAEVSIYPRNPENSLTSCFHFVEPVNMMGHVLIITGKTSF